MLNHFTMNPVKAGGLTEPWGGTALVINPAIQQASIEVFSKYGTQNRFITHSDTQYRNHSHTCTAY